MELKQYKRSQIADVFDITRDGLLKYEDRGLFLPKHIDKSNSYRYFTAEQVERIRLILSLRDIGFSLTEIENFFNNTLDLEAKRIELLSKIEQMQSFLALYSNNKSKEYVVTTKILPSHYVICKQVKLDKWQDIVKEVNNLTELMVDNKLKQPPSSIPYVVFDEKDFKLTDVSCTICLKVKGEKSELVTSVPTQKCISCFHYGDYEQLGNAYNFLYSYAKTNKLKVIGNPIERYIVSYANKLLSPTFITEVCLPIE